MLGCQPHPRLSGLTVSGLRRSGLYIIFTCHLCVCALNGRFVSGPYLLRHWHCVLGVVLPDGSFTLSFFCLACYQLQPQRRVTERTCLPSAGLLKKPAPQLVQEEESERERVHLCTPVCLSGTGLRHVKPFSKGGGPSAVQSVYASCLLVSRLQSVSLCTRSFI